MQAVDFRLLLVQRVLAQFQVVKLLIDGFLSLRETALVALLLVAAIANFLVQFVLELENFLFRFQDLLFFVFLRSPLRLFQQVFRVFFRATDLLFRGVLAIFIAGERAQREPDQRCQDNP